MRRRYLLTYDVADDKRRTALFEALKDVGEHVQFSVFLAELSRVELEQLRGLARRTIHHDADQLLIVDLGPADERRSGVGDGIEGDRQDVRPPAARAGRGLRPAPAARSPSQRRPGCATKVFVTVALPPPLPLGCHRRPPPATAGHRRPPPATAGHRRPPPARAGAYPRAAPWSPCSGTRSSSLATNHLRQSSTMPPPPCPSRHIHPLAERVGSRRRGWFYEAGPLPQRTRCGTVEAGRAPTRSGDCSTLPQRTRCGTVEALPECTVTGCCCSLPQRTRCGTVEATGLRPLSLSGRKPFRSARAAAPLKPLLPLRGRARRRPLPQRTRCGTVEARPAAGPGPTRLPLPQRTRCGTVEAGTTASGSTSTTHTPSAAHALRHR